MTLVQLATYGLPALWLLCNLVHAKSSPAGLWWRLSGAVLGLLPLDAKTVADKLGGKLPGAPAALVALSLAVVGWSSYEVACTPAQIQEARTLATDAAPYLADGCALAPDTGPAAPYLDVLCMTAEAADAALARLPSGTAAIVGVPPPPIVLSDAGIPQAPAARLPLYRLRILLARPTSPAPAASAVLQDMAASAARSRALLAAALDAGPG